jgi:cytochrome c biogenesis protein CcdA
MLFLFVRTGYSIERVPIEFLRYEVCNTCPDFEEYYQAYVHNEQVITSIQIDYGSKVSVRWIDFYSDEGRAKRELYNLSSVDWNTIVVNYEIVLKGGDRSIDESNLRGIIDFYLQPPSIHDVAVLSVTPTSNSITRGEILDINVTVKNEGNLTESFNVTAYYNDANLIDILPVDNLITGAEMSLIFQWNTTDVVEGNYNISARADNIENEADTQDNLRYDGVVEIRAASTPVTTRHDIAIISVIPSLTEAKAGEKINVTAVVKNVGTETESFTVSLYCNQSLIGSQAVTNLSSTETRQLTFVWDTTNKTVGSYIIKAQAMPVTNETYLIDNEFIYNNIGIKPPADQPIAPLGLMAMLSLAFFFGFMESFSPCIIIMLSFILSYTIGKETKFKTSFSQVMIFGMGFVSATAAIGLAFGLVLISMPAIQVSLTLIVCVVAILFGLNLLGLLKVPFETKPLIKSVARKYAITYVGLLFLGFIFYFLDPCIAPVFVSMVPILYSDAFYLILLVFCLAAIIPFIGIGIFAGSISRLARSTYRHRSIIRGVSGLILIGYAVYLIVVILTR